MKPLSGIRAVDFSKVLAGPLCTQYLAELGADVIKVEPPGSGDETRGWPPFTDGFGAVFLSVNRNKRSLALDLKAEGAGEVVARLVAGADIVIESYGDGVAERLGIGYEDLRRLNDRLIYCTISGFGRSGPLKANPGYDVILQAFSGMMAMTGDEGGSYIRSPISPIDQMTGMHAYAGILAALLERQRSGVGTLVEVSLFETAISLMAYTFQGYWERGTDPAKCGSTHEALCPYQAFETADGPLMLGVANDNLWRKFCAVLGLGDVVDDPRFARNADRVANRAETVRLVADVLATKSLDPLVEALIAAGVPCAPINRVSQVAAHPHLAARGLVVTHGEPGSGGIRSVTRPVVFGDETRTFGTPAPRLGADSLGVLREIGLDDEGIADLFAKGAVAAAP